MDRRFLAAGVAAGCALLMLVPTLTPAPWVPLERATQGDGPVRVEGVVATLRVEGPVTYVLLRNGTHAWISIREGPPLAPGDRIALLARPDGGMLQAQGEDVQVRQTTGVHLLRDIARHPWRHEGPLRVHATLGQVHRTVLYLRDLGHRLRVEPGKGTWPDPDDRGDRVVADGRLRYEPARLTFVLSLDGLVDA